MDKTTKIIQTALKEGRKTLSEYESKDVLKSYGIPVTREILVHSREECMKAAHAIGYPLVFKGCSPHLAHKTEKGLVRVDLRSEEEAILAFDDLTSRMEGNEGEVGAAHLVGDANVVCRLWKLFYSIATQRANLSREDHSR